MVRTKQLAQDGATLGQTLVWNGAAWTPSRGRLISTLSPSFGGTPPNFTYTFSADELARFSDSFAPGSLTATLPAISTLEAGQRVALYLPDGNPLSSIVFAVDAGDTIADPTAADEAATGPGVGVTIPAGTYTSATLLIFEGVPTTPFGVWRFIGDRKGTSGGGASSFPVTGVGQASPGNDIPAPFIDERSVSQASAGGSAWVDVGDELYEYLGFQSTADVVVAECTGVIKYTNTAAPAPANTTLQGFTLKSEWSLSSGGDVETVLTAPAGSGSANIRFQVVVSGPSRKLQLQVNELADASLTVTCDATVHVNPVVGESS